MIDVPNIWQIHFFSQTLLISPYLLFNGIGMIVGLFLLDYFLKNRLPFHQNKIYKLFVFSIMAGWVGAHILDWAVKDLSFGQAGFTFYGGLIFGLLFFSIICCKWFEIELLLPSINAAVIPLVFAHAIGRIGCFFAGCCHGLPLSTNHFLAPLFDIHPTQLYESGFLFLFGIYLLKIDKKQPSHLASNYFIGYGIFRFFIEFLRGDDRGFFYGLSTSQWISSLIVSLTLGVHMYKNILKKSECLSH